LRQFGDFDAITQWTEVQQKAVARQLITVIIPLLVTEYPAALLYAQAMIDFWILAQYRSHNEEILKYIDHALYHINALK
jgi:hypothetical protein